MSSEPNPRFNQYTEIIKNNQTVGFKLDDNDFQFLFDKFGGWYDEEGRYYNADAIECPPPEQSSDDESEEENKAKQEQKLQEKITDLKINQDNDRVQVIKNFDEILESYPQNEQIGISISLQPSVQNEDIVIEDFIYKKTNTKLQVKEGSIIGLIDQQLARQLIQLEGQKIQTVGQKPTVYIYIDLYDSIQVSTKMSKLQLQKKLNELMYEKNSDYANIIQEEQKGETVSFFQIRRDIASQLKEDLDYETQQQQ